MRQKSKVYLFGASGHGKVILDILRSQGKTVEYIYDDTPKFSCLHGVPVVNPTDLNVYSPLIISIGNNSIRKSISEKYNVVYDTAIHPNAMISPSVRIGAGSVIMQGATIQSDTLISEHCIINTGASVDHECIIHNYVHISPHATLCGNVEVGEGTWIGAGAIIIPGIKIGKWCIVGAGAVVIKDIEDNAVVVGNPARNINKSISSPSIGGG